MFTRKTNTFERICFNVRTYVSQYLFTAYVRTYIVTFERIFLRSNVNILTLFYVGTYK